MSSEVTWVLKQLGSVVGSTTTPLRRVNRDDSRVLEQDVRSTRGELQEANYIGATHVETVRDPIGTEYDADREVVVGVRVTGLHHSEWGHIDPDGQNGIPFGELVRRCKDVLWSERTWPDANPREEVYYENLELQNEANTSQQYSDCYRADWDVVFDGYEEL
ncbi:hypothetical protein WHO98_12190 (plasmid) [Halobacterium salinarum]|uniref:hypothetical protein n=1 Tax=Halobacterium salinarum TaxID=2242 RepID=UPI0030CD6438